MYALLIHSGFDDDDDSAGRFWNMVNNASNIVRYHELIV